MYKQMIPFVCYSNIDYLDVLQVQCKYLSKYDCPRYLCLNAKTSLYPFTKVLPYDTGLAFSKRLLQSLSFIEDEYIFLFQDMDIMVDVDLAIVERMVEVMKQQGIDRIDVKQQGGPPTIPLEDQAGLIKYDSLEWRYNVNPSIWKLSTLRTILQRFDKCYRTIEDDETQSFCAQFSFYRITHPTVVQSAYFQLSPWIVYMHITSRGKLIPIDANGMCDELKKTYKDILQSFPPGRVMKQHLYEL